MKDGHYFNPGASCIPEWLMRTRDLSPTDKLVYVRLVESAEDGTVLPRLKIIADSIGISVDEVQMSISDLMYENLIVRVGDDRLGFLQNEMMELKTETRYQREGDSHE